MRSLKVIVIIGVILGSGSCTSLKDAFQSSGGSPSVSSDWKKNGVYIVRKGDTLSRIAKKVDVSHQYLAEYNNLEDPSHLKVGQEIRIPTRAEKNHDHQPDKKDEQEPAIHTDHEKFIWPVAGKLEGLFGPRRNTHHDGVDIIIKRGTPIYAADDGEVVFCGRLSGYGNLVIVKHKDEYFTAYAHNEKNLVRKGQKVKRGKTVIGKVGMTGRATTPHLHFEVRYRELPRNPLFYLPKR